jgi:cadmium resistance protein CadD (predicted permease)
MKETFFKWLNTFLMLDLFLVLISFVWFAAAVIGRSANVDLGLDVWYKLWDPVFTPALGILMMGALVSGVSSWLIKRFKPSVEET